MKNYRKLNLFQKIQYPVCYNGMHVEKKKNAAKQGQTAGKARVVSLSGDTGFVFAGHAGERKFHEWSYSNVSNPVLPTQLNRAAVGKTWTMNALKSSQAAC